MKSHIKYIGVIDNTNKVHFVKFSTGVNIITGKSSTGKSAMIEIFDYCFGSSDYTVPAGVITENAAMYFVIISVNNSNVILGRKPNEMKAYFNSDCEENVIESIIEQKIDFFNEDYFVTLSDYKPLLSNLFGLIIDDVDEDLFAKQYRRAKKSRPTARHFTSFMLQHQNLIANKQSIFYRFDEKEKREQTIEQFKIFVGLVDADYFIYKQRLNDYETELTRIEKVLEKFNVNKKKLQNDLNDLLVEYQAIVGKKLLDDSSYAIESPAQTLDLLKKNNISVNPDSDEYIIQLKSLRKQKNEKLAEGRKLRIKKMNISASVSYANKYCDNVDNIPIIPEASIYNSQCPFCNNTNNNLLVESNKLEEAIIWLNEELSKTNYLLDSFKSQENSVSKEIIKNRDEINIIDEKINKIESIIEELDLDRSLEEQALKIKLKVENILEMVLQQKNKNYDKELSNTKKNIKKVKKLLKDKYDIENSLKNVEEKINDIMKDIGKNYDFEKSYKPINLKFSLDSFDLYHLDEGNNNKIYLRAMGSGANWLYCHLTLFTGLLKYFCLAKDKCVIPPILFLDQPSQVYFPTSIDIKEKFDPKELKRLQNKAKELDEDIQSVTNFYNQLVRFCSETLDETEIEPQIIITDHADNLKLANNIDFESLVDGRRWRKNGFINPIPEDNEKQGKSQDDFFTE